MYPKYDKLPVRIKSEQQDIADVLAGAKNPSQDVKALKLYDKTGQLDPHLPLIDEIRIYLATRQNKKQRSLGQDILDAFEAPLYGWDPNAVRIGIAAMLRAGLIKIVSGKKVYTNPADTELIAIMRNSKTFNKAEVILEETDVDTAVLMAVRTLLIKLTGNRKIDETPSDITVAAMKYLSEIKGKAKDAQIWAKPADFPLPESFLSGVGAMETLLGLTNPVHHVKEWHAKSTTIEAELNAILAVHDFYGKSAEMFQNTRELRQTLQGIEHRIPKGNVIHHFLANYTTAYRDCTIHDPDVWQTLQDNRAGVLTAVEELKRAWKKAATEALTPLTKRIEAEKATGALTAEELSPFASILADMAAEIEEEEELAKIAWLPDAIREQANEQINLIDQAIKNKNRGKEKKMQKVRLLLAPRIIKSAQEWSDFKGELDARVGAILNQGDEIELS